MEYILVKDNIITDHLCCSKKPEGAIEVPSNFPGYKGMDIRSLTDDYTSIKPLSVQIEEKIVEIPEGYKPDTKDYSFIRMTQEELDSKYPVEIWAIPDTYEEIEVHKTFKDNVLGYWAPSNTVKMRERQLYPFYKANKNGVWEIDTVKQEEYNLSKSKEDRADAVSKIVVTVDGMIFDGDEVSQERMSRTITAAKASNEPDSSTVTWVLADNTVATPTIAQLIKALRLAGEEQTKLWTIPYTKV